MLSEFIGCFALQFQINYVNLKPVIFKLCKNIEWSKIARKVFSFAISIKSSNGPVGI